MPQQRRLLDKISGMIEHNMPGSDMEKQLLHLIDANTYMNEHKCNPRTALRAQQRCYNLNNILKGFLVNK